MRVLLAKGQRLFIGGAILAMVAIATQPLWITPHLPVSDDGRMYFFRLLAFDQVLREGVVYPRWLPDLYFGYGYPILNYFSPLDVYVGEVLHILGLGFVEAFKGSLVFSLALAAFGAYALGLELFDDQAAAILISTIYLFAPFSMWDVYFRVGAPEMLSVGLLVWLVWAVRREFNRPKLGTFILVSLLLAALLFAHVATLVIVAPFLVAYVLFELFRLPYPQRMGRVRRVSLAVALGMSVSAIYWLPMVLELHWVKVGDGPSTLTNVFHASLSTLTNLVQPSLNYQYQFNGNAPLGLTTAGFGVVALVLGWIAHKTLSARSSVLFFGVVALIGALARTDLTSGVWAAIPGTGLLQFSWRLNILIDLGLAVTIGALPVLVPHFRSRYASQVGRSLYNRSIDPVPLFVALAIGGATVWATFADLQPTMMNYPDAPPTLADLVAFEGYSGFAGTSSFDAYLPNTVTEPATANSVDADYTAPNATMTLEQYAPTERVLDISTTESMSVTLRSFYMPDWQATIDGVPMATYPTTPLGLLTTTVPPGHHRIAFFLGDTPARQVGTFLSAVGLLMLMALGVLAVRRRDMQRMVLLVALTLVLSVTILPTVTALSAPAADLEPKGITVSPSLRLIGLTLDEGKFDGRAWYWTGAPSVLDIHLYWHVKKQVEDNPLTFRMVDSRGNAWVLGEPLPRLGTGFVEDWIPNEVVEDYYELPLDLGLAAGRYDLQMTLGDAQPFISVATIDLRRGSSAPAVPLPLARPVNARVGDSIELLSCDAPARALPGSHFTVTLEWLATETIHKNYAVFVQLLDAEGRAVAQVDSLSGIGIVPTSLWMPGRVVTDDEVIDLPQDLTPGIFKLIAGLYDNPDVERLQVTNAQGESSPDDVVELGQVKVPMQVRDARPSHPSDIMLGDAIRLFGYDLQHIGDHISLKLYWQARAKINADYTVFAHLVNADGDLVRQQDHFPGSGNYPTHIWDVGETVVDPYEWSIDGLAAGQYQVRVGMYSPENGERLVVRDRLGNWLRDRQVISDPFEWAR